MPLQHIQKVIVLAFGMSTVFSTGDSPQAPKTESWQRAGYAIAPSFVAKDLNNKKIELTAYRGKVVLLNFWATWCAPCLVEIPHFVDWQQKYGSRGFQVLGVSMDDGAQPVREVYHKYRLNYPVVMGDERLGEMYGGILGLPVTLLIDGKGTIRFKYQGEPDLKSMEREVQNLLKTQ